MLVFKLLKNMNSTFVYGIPWLWRRKILRLHRGVKIGQEAHQCAVGLVPHKAVNGG